jgi:hypothetical protein
VAMLPARVLLGDENVVVVERDAVVIGSEIGPPVAGESFRNRNHVNLCARCLRAGGED